MVVTLFISAFIAAAGGMLTYLFAKDETMLWRFSAGSVIGSALFGTVLFLAASVAGMSVPVVLIAVAATLLLLLLFRRPEIKRLYERDRSRAKSKFQGSGFKKLGRLTYYLFFFVLFAMFFERAMVITDAGIFTGGSNNFGDLPFHLGAIFSFADGANFPPQNPSFAGAKFSYPFISDLTTAAFVKLGAEVKDAMLVQNIIWAFSLLVIFERFVLKLVKSRLAAKLAPFILFFSGGLGFIWFFGDYFAQTKGFWEFLNNLAKDYTIGEEFRWGNSLTTLFLTQRSILLGMPITLVVLGFIWEKFSAIEDDPPPDGRAFFLVGLVAGLLPLVHLHSLFVLFVVGIFVLLMRPQIFRGWLLFAAGVAAIAVPELIWSLAGSASNASEFIGFHFGWDSRGENIMWFWIKNTGILIPIAALGIFLVFRHRNERSLAGSAEPPAKKTKKTRKKAETGSESSTALPLLRFYIPFALIFVIGNILRLAPWEWDNIKILIYWFALSIPFAAAALAWMFQQAAVGRIIAAACFITLVLAGSLDVWRTVSGQINYLVFTPDDIAIAERINARTAPDAILLNAPIHNSAVVLSGRVSLMRYTGHLHSHGIDYRQREIDVKKIYSGAADADDLLAKYGVDHVLFGEEERRIPGANEAYFTKFQLTADEGTAKLYKVR